jgi:hypothetical protein
MAEYNTITRAKRRVMHDLYMASAELRTAENRRKATADQLDRAKRGALGIDYEADGATAMV